jgi:hypothetical protein
MQRCVSSNILIRSFSIRRPVRPFESWFLGSECASGLDLMQRSKARCKVRRLVGGLIVFSDRELPVPLHGRDRLDPEGTPPKPHHGHDSGVVIEKAKKSSRREMSGADPRWIGSNFC